MRTSSQALHRSLRAQIQAMLSQTLADIKTPKEATTFLESFLTEAEYDMLTKRLAIAYWLKNNRSYANIKDNLKVSSATIASVQNMMTKDGFQLALKKVEAEEWAQKWAERIRKFVGK